MNTLKILFRPLILSHGLVILTFLSFAAQGQIAEMNRAGPGYVFSYSVIDARVDASVLVRALEGSITADLNRRGATVYAIWTPAAKPGAAPFAGLANNQVVLMAAWTRQTIDPLADLDAQLLGLPIVSAVSSRLFEPVYLSEELQVPTGNGFYVHREERYAAENVEAAIRLSEEAWQTWEPAWGVRITGLFREVNTNAQEINLNRIAWYPSYEVWQDTRNFSRDPESARRFQERRTLLIEGSGVAIATDRVVP